MKSLLPVVLKHITCNISDIVSNTGIIAIITSIIGFDKYIAILAKTPPKNNEPVSPINTFAGWKLYIKNPIQLPAITLESIDNGSFPLLKAIIDKIIEQERAARSILGKNQIELEDMVYRCFGILINARKLKWKEAIELMSNVKMGVDMGVIKELSDEDISKIYFYMEPANLQKYFNQNLDGYDREIKRAEMIRNVIKK